MKRRYFLGGLFSVPALTTLPFISKKGWSQEGSYFYHGRSKDYQELKIIEPGRTIKKIESFTNGAMCIVKVTTNDGLEGFGQISTYDTDISVAILHRKIANSVLEKDLSQIDRIVDECIENNYKFPWSYICRALSGVDTAIWDLYGKINKKPVVELLGGKAGPYPAYGSSMSREIKPEEEATRLKKLKNTQGFRAFKVRLGKVNGHNQDMWLGRTENLIPQIRNAVGAETTLLADANSCYTPIKAIEIGKLMQEYNYYQFEEPCPYWELEWTKEVTDNLEMKVSGGEQDNDLAQWRRMINMGAVDIAQPDVCYLGGLTRTLRVAKMAEEQNIQVVPHSANLSLVTVFAVHLLGAMPNAAPFLEYTIEYEADVNRQAKMVYSPQLMVRDGVVQIPEDPGWGVTIHQDWLQKAAYKKSEV